MVIPARVNPADSSGPMSVGGPNTRTVTLRAALLGIESPHPGRHLPAQLWDPPAPHVAEQTFDGRGATARAGPGRRCRTLHQARGGATIPEAETNRTPRRWRRRLTDRGWGRPGRPVDRHPDCRDGRAESRGCNARGSAQRSRTARSAAPRSPVDRGTRQQLPGQVLDPHPVLGGQHRAHPGLMAELPGRGHTSGRCGRRPNRPNAEGGTA
jgi:hypothetical protein